MDWLRNVLKGTASSSYNFDGDSYRSHEDSEDDGSFSAKDYGEESDTIASNCYQLDGSAYNEDQNQNEYRAQYGDESTDAWLYPETTEEELALSLRQSLNIENCPRYDNISNHMLQHYPSSPSAYRELDQYGRNEINYEEFCNPQTDADPESVEAVDHCHSKLSYERPDPPILCDVCNEPVPIDLSGNPKYREVPVFLQKYCRKHRHDGTPKCFSCKRREPRGIQYSTYPDGRAICGDCKKSAVMSRRECQPLIDEVLKFYEDLDMKVWQEEIPIDMLDQNEMNDEGHGGLVRGFASSKEHPLVTTIIQTPRFGADKEIIGVKHQRFKLVSHKHVGRIGLLSGCPRLYIGRTLAHEMMHAWICLEGYHQSSRKYIEGFVGAIPSDLEEGVCQVMAHTWIESKIREMSNDLSGSSSQLQFERKLAKQIKHGVETKHDPVYGDGFRLAHRVVNKYGLRGTLNYVRLTGSFPE